MPPLMEKTPLVCFIQASRLTWVGMQYIVATTEYLDVVTDNGEQITCTCGKPACIHILTVQCQQAQDSQINAHRDMYCALFDLGYIE